jgi:hypothetical protein
MRHALVLGLAGLAANLAGAVTMRDFGPAWYPLVLTVLAVPTAWLGGKLRLVQVERPAKAIDTSPAA